MKIASVLAVFLRGGEEKFAGSKQGWERESSWERKGFGPFGRF